MADLALVHRPALLNAKAGAFGASSSRDRITIEALPEGHVLHVLARKNGGDIESKLAQIGDGGAYALRGFSPGQWFVIGDAALHPEEIATKSTVLEGSASIADQSHGRVRIAISGAFVTTVLAKGTAIDLDPSMFPVGSSAMTLIGHISALITRTGDDRFELLVLRGFAESLWDDLIRMGLEFGVDARAAG